jgi:3-oxoacyl-[acyl-carrier-protein] synthase II
VFGSLGAFLVLEARQHAEARNARPLARLTAVLSDQSRRSPGSTTAALARQWQSLESRFAPGRIAVLSGATGAEPATGEERAFLQTHPDLAVRATGTYIGHSLEAQFVMNIALATLALAHEKLFPPADASGVERLMEGPLSQVLVTGVGHRRGEGMALVEAPQ